MTTWQDEMPSADYSKGTPGCAPEPAPPRALRAGSLSLLLDGVDLRRIEANGTELVRRIGIAVRDAGWRTVPGKVSEVVLSESATSFHLTCEVHHSSPDLEIAWRGSVSGSEQGQITYDVHMTAERPFDYRRIGLFVLHPPETCSGQEYVAACHHGEVKGRIPNGIVPQRFVAGFPEPVVPAFRRLTLHPLDRHELIFDFEGDLFEIEDQRNWTDASFKTYSTPIALGPQHAERGKHISQTVRVSFTSPGSVARRARSEPVTLTLEPRTSGRLPAIGVALPASGCLSTAEVSLLSPLQLSHLRFDIDVACLRNSGPVQLEALHAAQTAASQLDARLELGLFATLDSEKALYNLAPHLKGHPVARVLVLSASGTVPNEDEVTPDGLAELVREALGPSLPEARIVGGTDYYFCQINRRRPAVAGWDGLVYSINPQVHAFDDLTLFENLSPQGTTVSQARQLSHGAPVYISPVTLLPRKDPRTGMSPGNGGDPRQSSNLAAAWTLGSLKTLAEAGVVAATYYVATGPNGLMPGHSAAPRHGEPPPVYPVWHVLHAVAGLRDAVAITCTPSDPLTVAGLAIRAEQNLRLLVANLTARDEDCVVRGLPGQVNEIHVLATADRNKTTPAAGSDRLKGVRPKDRELRLSLGPYAVTAIDVHHTREESG